MIDAHCSRRMGSYVAAFDEFSSANDEYSAFRHYSESFQREFRVLGRVGASYDKVAIEIGFP